jgi:hypothetical protein
MPEHLFDTLVGPPGDANIGSPNELGISFQVTKTCRVTKLGWYRVATGGSGVNALNLWDAGFLGGLIRLTTLSDDGTVGWQWTTIANPINLFVGRRYIVSLHTVGSTQHVGTIGGTTVLPQGTLLVHGPSGRDFAASATTVYPNNHDNFAGYLVDVEVEDIGVDNPDLATAGDLIDAKLAAWFRSDNDNSHKTEIPWLTWGQASGANSNAQNAWLSAQGAETAAQGNASAISNVSTQVDGISGNVGTLLNRLSADLATLLNESSQALADWLNGAAADPTKWWTGFLDRFTRSSGGSGFGLPDALEGWTLVDETDWSEELAWPVPADRYILTFTETPPRTPGTSVAGVQWHPRLAWWCELNTGLATERHYIDFADTILQSPTGRMFGVLLNGGVNTAGHIQAWTKD